MKLLSEFLGESRDFSRWEIAGLLKAYGGRILEEGERYITFETEEPEKVVRRMAYFRRVGKVIDDFESFELRGKGRFAMREVKGANRHSLIHDYAKLIRGKVDLKNPDSLFYIYNLDDTVVTELISERDMKMLLDPRYRTRPMVHPSSISPLVARGMINVSGLREGESFIDPFAGTGTYLIEGYRMGINPFGIDKSKEMADGGNRNMEYFSFPAKITQGDFSIFLSNKEVKGVITDPPYGRGSRIFSQSRHSLYKDFLSLLAQFRGAKVFCLPGAELLALANDYLDLVEIAKIRVHSSLTRLVVASFDYPLTPPRIKE